MTEEKRLSVLRKTVLASYIITVAAYVTAIVFLLYNRSVTLWIVNITTVFYIFIVRSLDKYYNKSFVKANLILSIASLFEEYKLTSREGPSQKSLSELQIFPAGKDGKGVVCGIGIKGKAKEQEASLCELTTYYQTNSNNKKTPCILRGLWMEFSIKQNTDTQYVLVEDETLDNETAESYYSANGFECVKITEPVFREYTLYAKKQNKKYEAAFIKSVKGVLNTQTQSKGKHIFCLKDDKLFAFIDQRVLAASIPIKEPVTEKILKWNWCPEFNYLFEHANDII